MSDLAPVAADGTPIVYEPVRPLIEVIGPPTPKTAQVVLAILVRGTARRDARQQDAA